MIHPTAIIDPGARLAADVEVGPYAVIGADVEIGAGCWVGPHALINGPTRIGRDNRIFQFASVGEAPQDKSYRGEPTRLEIGDRNVIRECATIHRGSMKDQGVTRIGDDNLIMAYVHIAHDCIVGNGTIFSNNASLAGHVRVEDCAILGGFTMVHQFCAIGAHCFTGMGAAISKDVPPYVMVAGHPAHPHGINAEGLKRRGFGQETIQALRRAYKVLYRSGLTLDQALDTLAPAAEQTPEVAAIVAFIRCGRRSVIR